MNRTICNKTYVLWSLVALILNSLLIGTAFADEDNKNDNSIFGFLAKRVYVGANVGVSSNNAASTFNDGSVSNTDLTKAGFTGKAYLGITATKYFSFELGYVDIGKSTLKGDSNGSGAIYDAGPIKSTDKVNGESLTTVGRYPVSDRLTLFGEAGVLFWHSKEKLADPVSADYINQSGNSFTYGAGFEYDIGDKDFFIWRVELQQYVVGENSYDVTTGSTGLIYRY